MTGDTQEQAKKNVMRENQSALVRKREPEKHTHTNLRDILCWHDGVANVPASWSWCQDSTRREVGEVGLDLGQWSCRHDEPLLGLGRGYHSG